jgi:hypothetical protein
VLLSRLQTMTMCNAASASMSGGTTTDVGWKPLVDRL